MVDFLKYVNNLRFEQDPNYTFMKGCFQKILTRLNFHKNNNIKYFIYFIILFKNERK